jgi:HigB_toxin, RelE-like toxic component of a toxin-antitoxin system
MARRIAILKQLWITGIKLLKRQIGLIWLKFSLFFRASEAVGNFTVFNIKGNKYRLIVSIDYERQLIYIKYIFTHAEYDKENWKNGPYF